MNREFLLRSLSDLIVENSRPEDDPYVPYPDKSALTNALREFRCRHAQGEEALRQQTLEDINDYLHNRAWPDEMTRRCRTYCVVDRIGYLAGTLRIVAYFTVCLEQFDEELLRLDLRTPLESGGIDQGRRTIPAYLIAQLACSEAYSHDEFNGASLLGLAEDMIEQASAIVGGDLIYLQCDDELVGYYSDLGYTPAGTDSGTPPRIIMLKSIDVDKVEDDLGSEL